MSELILNTQNISVDVALTTTTSAHVKTFKGCGSNIPDSQDCFIDDIIVNNDFKVTDVIVTLYNLVHPWVGDLVVQLHHLETHGCRSVPETWSTTIPFQWL